VKLTFLDSGVLIAAAKGSHPLQRRAIRILDDPARAFASSGIVKLEVLPKATYHRKEPEVQFYNAFFAAVSRWAEVDERLVQRALEEANRYGLGARDALHVAAALLLGAEGSSLLRSPQSPSTVPKESGWSRSRTDWRLEGQEMGGLAD
jgi:hypothetical protein